MNKIFEVIKNNPLWNGIGFNDFEKLFNCIEGKTIFYKKGDIILLSGNAVSFVGLIIVGRVKILKEDISGNTSILTELSAPELFGEVLACAETEHSPVTVEAAEESEVLFINYKKIISACSSSCSYHSKLIENMLKLIARKNLLLNQKIEVLSKRTTREKIQLFFDIQGCAAKKFAIPYNREEMAQYLCVDRSALSNELCKMRDEGLINFRKNEFEIL